MSAVNGKKSIKRQKKWRAEQNTGARLEAAAALIVVQESPTRSGMSRARIKSGWTQNNELRVLLESGAGFGRFMLITHNYSTKTLAGFGLAGPNLCTVTATCPLARVQLTTRTHDRQTNGR